MSPAARKLPEEVKAVLDREHVIAILLYGSVARGEEKPISDIDLCVITGTKIQRAERERILSHASPRLDITLFWDLPLPIRSACSAKDNSSGARRGSPSTGSGGRRSGATGRSGGCPPARTEDARCLGPTTASR